MNIIKLIAGKYIRAAYYKGFDEGNARGYQVGYREGKEDFAKDLAKSVQPKKDTRFKKGYTPWNKGKKIKKGK